MKVLVLGAAGGMAYAIIKDLMEIDPEQVSKIVAADKNYERAKQVADKYGSDKLTPAAIDVTDHVKLIGMMRGFDVVINATVPFGAIPVDVVKASLEAQVNVIDLGAGHEETRQCLAMNDAFERAGLAAILGLGSSPGITNLMARALVDKLDTVEAIEMGFAYASLGTSTLPFKVPFLGALHEFIMKPVVFRDGKFETLPPQSGLKDIQYPEPIGVRRSFYIGHPELATFPNSFKDKGVKNVSIRAGFTPDFVQKVNFLIDLGIINEQPTKVNDATVVPLDFLTACLAKLLPERGEVKDYGCSQVIARGEKDGERLEYSALMVNYPYKGLTHAQHRTGHSPAIGARMLYKGEITKKGVFPPEAGVAPKPFFRELARRELEIAITSKTFI